MMPVPTNPKLSQVQSEFNAPASAKLSAFYRDGAYVPDTATNSGVPVSGALFLSDLIGASSLALTLTGDQQPNGSCTGVDAPCTATTDSITCTVSGGSSPYTITTEKRPNYTDFVVVEGAQSANARTFEYRTTNVDQTITYNSEYRIRVADSLGSVALTDYFAVSNSHTYTEGNLVISGSNIISTFFQPGNSAATGTAVFSYSLTGGGTGAHTKSFSVVSGTAYDTASVYFSDTENDSFKINVACVSGQTSSWNETWTIRVTVNRGGQTATKDIQISVQGAT
jgi:hypothetical protein